MSSVRVDMIHGPTLKKIIVFALPVIASGVLQLLFNAVDIIVVGQFSGQNALAAVGSTSSLINLLVNLFIGLSIGASVLLGQYIGAHDYENASETVHTAMALSILGGVIMIFVGFFLARPLLEMMDTPPEVIDLSVLYMRIYFVGMPAFMIYNFGAALLRAIGDTKHPLYFLTIAGVINAILNVFFVTQLSMSVDGVAYATIISQAVSAVLIVISLMHSDGFMHLDFKKVHFYGHKVRQMLRIGLPAGLQGIVFSISNVLIQSSVNSFGPTVMAGNTAASNIEGFVYTAMNALYQTNLSFTSQNKGAQEYKRCDRILLQCLFIVTIVGLVLGVGAYVASPVLLRLYNSDPTVIHYGTIRLSFISVPYFLCGIMDVFVGSLRGLGSSILPMIVSLSGACLFRTIWIYTIFANVGTIQSLYISYPISWLLTASVHMLCYIGLRIKINHQLSKK